MLSFTLDNLIGIILGLITLTSAGWGFWKYVDAKIEGVRKEANDKATAAMAAVEAVKGECVRRDEIKRIDDGIMNINQRMDRVIEVLLSNKAAA